MTGRRHRARCGVLTLGIALLAVRCRLDRASQAGDTGHVSDEAASHQSPAVPDGSRDRLADASVEREGTGADGASGGLTPIAPEPLFTNLTIAGYPQGVVSVPNGATTRRPVLLVLHGSGDRPDWNCDAWRHITDARGFVLCPRGEYDPRESTAGDTRYTHRGGAYLRRHVDAALQALGARFGPYVDTDTPVLVGFSLGATEVAQIAIADPARFARIALLEGGHGVWTAASARDFSSKGGRRVLFGCGSAWCTPLAKASAALLERHGIETRVVYAAVGHTTDRPLQDAIMREVSWFLAEDPRWEPAR
ncbi:MAG TPA: hypothetical protein VEK07_01485 [Polyangiaceae bacterium]|nr:hypothetical protein [Polyangiaceae bacterium]